MGHYENIISTELGLWRYKILKEPSFISKLASKTQKKINNLIPEKAHKTLTYAIRQMVKAVLFGSTYISIKPRADLSLMHREALAKQAIENYKKTGATEGGITGSGGFLMNFADFPLLLSIKIKMLFDIAAYYGYDVNDYKERLYLLYIFQLTFSNKTESRNTFLKMEHWDEMAHKLPENINDFDWRTFQQQYRDYIDLAKLAQIIPFIGAAVGAVANYQLIKKLGKTAMMAYRLRILESESRQV